VGINNKLNSFLGGGHIKNVFVASDESRILVEKDGKEFALDIDLNWVGDEAELEVRLTEKITTYKTINVGGNE
jgi:uncharacterized protein YllA (UPF0747 family)